MPRRAAPRPKDIAAIVKLLKDAGETIYGVEVRLDGSFVVQTQDTQLTANQREDAEIDRELAEYRKQHGYG